MSDGTVQANLEQRVAWLEQRVQLLGSAAATARGTGMTSESFLRRSFSVWGHWLVAHLIVTIIVSFVFGCISAVFGAALFDTIRRAAEEAAQDQGVQMFFLGLL